jgi:multidrug resistance efflux pump
MAGSIVMSQEAYPSKEAVSDQRPGPVVGRTGRWRRLSGRCFKLGMAAVLAFVSLRAITSEQGYIGTNNAVLSSQITVLRAPIEGYVTAGELAPGQSVERSSVVEAILNARPNDTALADLESDLKRLLRQHEAALLQRSALSTLLTELANRAAVGNAAQVSRISANIELYHGKAASAETHRDQVKRDYERKLALLNSGNAAIADVDHVRSDFLAATQEAAAALAAMQVEISVRDAAQNGVLVEPGSNDVTYSIQRADEIRILLTQIDRSIADLDSAAEQTREKLQNHRRREQTEASIIVPISGMIWKVGALNGERVSPGDIALELVDCSHAFVMASIPQYRIPDVSLGMEARFKFVGETSERFARVVSVESGGLTERAMRFAAIPLPEREPSATVILSPFSMPNTASECLVGRTARVLLPLRESSLLHTLARWVGLDQIWHWLVS